MCTAAQSIGQMGQKLQKAEGKPTAWPVGLTHAGAVRQDHAIGKALPELSAACDVASKSTPAAVAGLATVAEPIGQALQAQGMPRAPKGRNET